MAAVRSEPSVLHLDLDAFFAAVEQRDKPSLRGKPVVVGGIGPRGVVATASYEARAFGIGSAMPATQARALCPNAAFLGGRFEAYRAVSEIVMGLLRELSPAVEPLSLDEAFADLAVTDSGWDVERVRTVAADLKAAVHDATGLTASVGAGTSKLIAKIASDLDKPDGLVVVEPGTELDLLHPMPVRKLWTVGPATAERLRRAGVHTVADLAAVDETELVGLLGQAHGKLLARLSRGEDDRPVSPHRESKSVSVEDTFERDVVERALLTENCDRMAATVSRRLRAASLSGRTVTVKIRRHDFQSHTRSTTLPGPTDDARTIAATARRLLAEIDTSDGIRLLGVGVSGLVDWAQEDLFAEDADDEVPEPAPEPAEPAVRRWTPGQDVRHAVHGDGWVQGSGVGRVTVRFETRWTPPGRIRTFAIDDPDLTERPAVVPESGAAGAG
ncbi:DNA polymerase IV [Sporichthya brevicatena]|uniref:DNA polymerase IV n=1 Tax=Sporichthya brevicatena TaxID=171442 RepID=A0ABN1HCB0_9ACTN